METFFCVEFDVIFLNCYNIFEIVVYIQGLGHDIKSVCVCVCVCVCVGGWVGGCVGGVGVCEGARGGTRIPKKCL